MTPASTSPPETLADHSAGTTLLLNVAHALDHMFLLIFATAISVIAADFGFASWEQLMPYGAAAFFLFGVGSVPSGRLGDLWGRRPMMLVFFFGMGAAALLAAATQNAWQMAVALALLGTFASTYHPVGIPMLLQATRRPGWTIGVNGLSGNLGIALAALSTGLAVKHFGWRAAFAIPGLVALACGFFFARITPRESHAPNQRTSRVVAVPASVVARVFVVMTAAAATGSLLFNFTTNGNPELLKSRLAGIVGDPATLGLLLAAVYAVASLAQLIVGRLLDRYPLKRVYIATVALQPPLFLLAARAEGWQLYALQLLFMIAVFGAIPFTDVLIARYVDDRLRSRVAGVRLAISFGVSSVAVALLGPVVKAAGFPVLLVALAVISACTLATVAFLPGDERTVLPAACGASGASRRIWTVLARAHCREFVEAKIGERDTGVQRCDQVRDRDQRQRREHERKEEEPAPRGADELRQLVRARMERERIVAEEALVQPRIEKKRGCDVDGREHEQHQRQEPERQEYRDAGQRIGDAAGKRSTAAAFECREIAHRHALHDHRHRQYSNRDERRECRGEHEEQRSDDAGTGVAPPVRRAEHDRGERSRQRLPRQPPDQRPQQRGAEKRQEDDRHHARAEQERQRARKRDEHSAWPGRVPRPHRIIRVW